MGFGDLREEKHQKGRRRIRKGERDSRVLFSACLRSNALLLKKVKEMAFSILDHAENDMMPLARFFVCLSFPSFVFPCRIRASMRRNQSFDKVVDTNQHFGTYFWTAWLKLASCLPVKNLNYFK